MGGPTSPNAGLSSLTFDRAGNVYVSYSFNGLIWTTGPGGGLRICANQEDEIVVVDAQGKVIAKCGDFDGITEDAQVRGLLFPASLAFSLDGKTLYVSNVTLFLPYAGGKPAIDSAWTLEVNRYTVAKMAPRFAPRSHRWRTTLTNDRGGEDAFSG